MKKLFIILLLIFVYGEAFPQKSANVCYIANEGFLVEVSGKKIMFDGLFGGFKADWCDVPSSETKTKLENAEPPFDNVDLLFFSHYHSDHFNKDMVVSHLLKNTNCKVVCPAQVYKKLEADERFADISRNIFTFTPDINKDTSVTIDGMNLKIYRLEHSPYMDKDSVSGKETNRHRNVENIGILLDVNGVRIFHCGDINPWNEEQISKYNLADEHIGIAFLDRIYLTNREGKGIDIINKYIKPQISVFMHLDPPYRETYKKILQQVADVLPNEGLFDNSMDCKEIIIKE